MPPVAVAAYNMATIYYLSSVSCSSLPNKPAPSYNTFKASRLQKLYGGDSKKKIPMETWFEAYFDGELDANHDILHMIETRYDWASFEFTLSQVKFFLTQVSYHLSLITADLLFS